MLELADRLVPLLRAGVPVAVATCIDVVGSAPHGIGSSMALPLGGAPLGAVSGGCVEAAALADCRAVLAGRPAVVRRHGFGDAEGASAGLACGGEVDVLTTLLHGDSAAALLPQLERALRGEPAAIALVAAGPDGLVGALSAGEEVPRLPAARLRAALKGIRDTGRSGAALLECAPVPFRILVDVAAPAPRLLLIGATETAAAVSSAASALGFAVTVCDVRPDFAAASRFPAARAVLVGRPHEVLAAFAPTDRDAVCLLSHDEDLDALALAAALESAAGYVGAQGSRATTARRRARLADLGVEPAALRRLHAPIGLDLGARTPAETAVSIVAELLAVRTGAAAASLRAGTGPIHRTPEPVPSAS